MKNQIPFIFIACLVSLVHLQSIPPQSSSDDLSISEKQKEKEEEDKKLQNESDFVYDEDIAKQLAAFSILTYCSEENIKTGFCGEPCTLVPQGLQFISIVEESQSDSLAVIGYSPDNDAIIIGFRGTISFNNWKSNLNVKQIDYPPCSSLGCKVHSGFFDHFQDIKQQLQESFTRLKRRFPFSKVYVTGHSLGGAVAQLAIEYIFELNGKKLLQAVYTFGAPKVGNKQFSDWFNYHKFTEQFARITLNKDPVPHVPFLFFKHAGPEVFYENRQNNKYKICLNPEDSQCSKGTIFFYVNDDHTSYFKWDQQEILNICSL